MSDITSYFEYLDDLRESAETNMYGAGQYLTDRFGLGKSEASKILLSWMKTFDSSKTPAERADLVKAADLT